MEIAHTDNAPLVKHKSSSDKLLQNQHCGDPGLPSIGEYAELAQRHPALTPFHC